MIEACRLHGESVGCGSIMGIMVREIGSKTVKKRGKFYGMELPRVGAFTEKWGSGYRNPVQILG